MKLPHLVPGFFLQRMNRFLATVEVEGKTHPTFVPNSGRMEELLLEGVQVYLKDRRKLPGKTHYELVLVKKEDTLVGLDSRMPPSILEEAVLRGRVMPGLKPIGREPSLGNGRADLLLQGKGSQVWVETKSVNLVENKVALFPDAPTIRGTKHMNALRNLVETRKGEAWVVFIIQRKDAEAFSPFTKRDPLFAQALKEAYKRGVKVVAFRSLVTLKEIILDREVPVLL